MKLFTPWHLEPSLLSIKRELDMSLCPHLELGIGPVDVHVYVPLSSTARAFPETGQFLVPSPAVIPALNCSHGSCRILFKWPQNRESSRRWPLSFNLDTTIKSSSDVPFPPWPHKKLLIRPRIDRILTAFQSSTGYRTDNI